MNNTKERLLDATFKLISKKGYLGATTREIARRAGVTELTLFRHFGSKEKLFVEVLKKYSFLPKLKVLLPELKEMSYKKSLLILGERFIETLKDRKTLIKIMLSEVKLYPNKIKDLYSSFINEIISILADYFSYLQSKKVTRHFSPEIAARAFLGMIFSYFLSEEIMTGHPIDKIKTRKILKEFTYIFMEGTIKRGM
ncbi:MAG: TetR/AcrR family transcriptional regulator [Thermodesulfovibrionales bacterium]